VFDYVEGGAENELSLRANEAAFREWSFVPVNLRDVSACDPSVELFGRRFPLPLVLAPTGYARMMHPEGELAVARAAGRAGLPYALSTVASTSIEELAATGHPDLWFQLYIWRDRALTYELLARAWEAGYQILEVSVDVPVPGHRIRDVRNGLTIPPQLDPRTLLDIASHPRYWVGMLRSPELQFANAPPGVGDQGGVTIQNMTALFDPSVTWDDFADVRSRWPGKLLIKGCLGAEDAVLAVSAGADGVHLSNHGGRQLDRAVPPLELLPTVRKAIGDESVIVVDSGIRDGADVAIALALGADAAAIGRAYLYGLMVGGEAGVEHAIRLLSAQLRRTLQLLGTRSIADLRARGSSALVRRGAPAAAGERGRNQA
jgi:L-lactate dehydrogenase (cytochrome)